jgi:hypothetical protein
MPAIAASSAAFLSKLIDKHALFSLAVKRYMDSRAQYATEALEEPTLEKVIRALFDNTVAFLTTPGHPPTCMTLAGAMGCSVDAAPARDLMKEVRRQERSCHQGAPSRSSKKRRVVEGHQCGRLHPVPVIDSRRLIRSGSEWIDEGGTEADLPDGPSASGLLRLVVCCSTGWRDELVGCGNLDSQIAGSSR